ncbi:hypothetical protein [Celerinatantimonas sp. YJH-8]|uniref:hypothetical protein n=1 Tax=Celerinatantimonas sp. YJH-8 TaxID=3228714 RepID=UPI0038CA52D2
MTDSINFHSIHSVVYKLKNALTHLPTHRTSTPTSNVDLYEHIPDMTNAFIDMGLAALNGAKLKIVRINLDEKNHTAISAPEAQIMLKKTPIEKLTGVNQT